MRAVLKGPYRPKNVAKYKGDPTKIVYRSQYELTYMRWCDRNPAVLEWSSEQTIIRYRSIVDEAIERKKKLTKKRWHRYYVDFYVKLRTTKGEIKKYLIEVKPLHETVAPIFEGTNKSKKTQMYQTKTWIVNQAKWAAAEAYCKRYGMEFRKVTEVELYGRK